MPARCDLQLARVEGIFAHDSCAPPNRADDQRNAPPDWSGQANPRCLAGRRVTCGERLLGCFINCIFAQSLRFGSEPVVELRAWLITSLEVEFVGSSSYSFFERGHLDCGIWGACWGWHRITFGDHRSTDCGWSEGYARDAVMPQDLRALGIAKAAPRRLSVDGKRRTNIF